MDNKIKRLSRSFICLSLLIGSSMVVVIPVKALNNNIINNKIMIKPEIKSQSTLDLNKDEYNIYIKKIEDNLNNNNIDEAKRNIDIALNFANKIKDNEIKKSKITNINKLIDNLNERQANSFLKKAVINLGNNKLSETEDDLITAFNYGNQISDSLIRQPIVNMIIKIQNRISVLPRK